MSFDKLRIYIRKSDPDIQSVYNQVQQGSLILSPTYQRTAGIWDPTKRSRLRAYPVDSGNALCVHKTRIEAHAPNHSAPLAPTRPLGYAEGWRKGWSAQRGGSPRLWWPWGWPCLWAATRSPGSGSQMPKKMSFVSGLRREAAC